ncbi:CarD family transcriptional regulator [uncultured Ferrovibrio sp.]|uniref:CarD family transcriptional regulator n=1 Tax=uncultured Ferrovibrio sp. TaxID=1576913 RepID=UPI002614AC65|nr:CarD family transcriptional regulator [uncultured Ferrovibrio sp.]
MKKAKTKSPAKAKTAAASKAKPAKTKQPAARAAAAKKPATVKQKAPAKTAAKPAPKAAAKSVKATAPASSQTARKKTETKPAKTAAAVKATKTQASAAPAAKPAKASAASAAKAAAPAKPTPPSKPLAVSAPPSRPLPQPVRPAAMDPKPQQPSSKVVQLKPVPAKVKVDFAAGDYVVYPTHGVGKILRIERQMIAGFELDLMVVEFERDKMTVRVPLSKVASVGIRKLSSPQKMRTALETLKGRARIKRAMWSRRAQEYEAKINSGDPVSIAEVVRDLHRNAGQPDQSYSERQIYESALDRLMRELAAVERIDEETATKKLEKILKAA